ncbi:MAG: shikimate dehydrogenase [Xanthomonadaceae bacterium]|nr:shikimate dehydrogenase [Xanthomonadaceae bacterium]
MSDATPRYAVFGHPVAHSLSPAIHRAFAQQLGLAIDYQALDLAPGVFTAAARAFFADGAKGANVTVPHKAAALALADQRSIEAQRTGSANVLSRRDDGTIAAHSTDGDGLVRDLTERYRVDLRGHDALLRGAGGAARAAAFALLDAGVRSLTVVNRSAAAADVLVDALGQPGRARSRYWADLGSIGTFDLVLNATSAGVLGQRLDLPFGLLTERALCYDLSYGAAAGDFIAWARAGGARYAFDGLGMLVETSALAFAHWHGQRPDGEAVFQTLRARYPQA